MKTKEYEIAVVLLPVSELPNTHAALCIEPLVLRQLNQKDRYVIKTATMEPVFGIGRNAVINELRDKIARFLDSTEVRHGDVEYTTVSVEYSSKK